jgi:antitoxin (DNA-binding transcriptional repressor) of toxin-antitoxin stability system
METKISDADLAERLGAVLERVRAGERFVIQHGGRTVAVLAPPPGATGSTGRELARRLGHLRVPGDGFAGEIETIRAEQGRPTIPEWPD